MLTPTKWFVYDLWYEKKPITFLKEFMDTPLIEKTKDYHIFKALNFNREKSKRHVQKLKQIILKENLLHIHPIVVNHEMEIIDGQHRLQAAKELDLDVFYIKGNVSYGHVLTSNLAQNKASLQDVVKFYAEKDAMPSYIALNGLIKDLDISPKAIIALIFGVASNSIIEFIKSGKFDLPSNQPLMEKIVSSFKEFKEFAKQKRITPMSMFSSSNFTISYRNLILLSDFNGSIWLSKLEQRWFELKPQLNSKEWTKQLIGIYNWKNHYPLNYA